MKAQELVKSIKQSEDSTGNWYASRLLDLYFDIMDWEEEGHIEGVTPSRPKNDKMRIQCEDGIVWIYKGDAKLTYKIISHHEQAETYPRRHMRTASPYERTRAMVYATGNKWAIENFNATHC